VESLSVIIPTLNEADAIFNTLSALQPLRVRGHEVLVIDGGSNDDTVSIAKLLSDSIIQSRRGRARQMNAGASWAQGSVFWFVHGDTITPNNADYLIAEQLKSYREKWGHFDVRLSGSHPMLRVVERLMNLRSRITSIATGDQGIFVRRHLFEAVGGFPEIPLMEDIALSRVLKHHGAPVCVREPLITSSRRWQEHGILRTILLMWRLRFYYALGVDPVRLAKRYDGT
jgi:Glycosyltransferases, probably involved in cell wall biogenesis